MRRALDIDLPSSGDPAVDRALRTVRLIAQKEKDAMAQTQLTIVNNINADVKVWLTVGVFSGNVTIGDIPFLTPVPGDPNQGTFTLAANGGSESYTPPSGTTLSGNICFGGPPINCPTPGFPKAVNIFEFTLDVASGQETIDISCVAGVNSIMEVAMSGGGIWNAGSTQPQVTSFHNGLPCGNTGLVGVYPIGCDECTASVNPPQCNPSVPPEPCQSEPICNVQRDASAAGGTVTVKLVAFLENTFAASGTA